MIVHAHIYLCVFVSQQMNALHWLKEEDGGKEEKGGGVHQLKSGPK